MKSIAIFGSSRSGKSTLARMISKKYPNYHIIICDDIRGAFQRVLPDNNINNFNGEGMREDFPNFLACLFYRNIKRGKGEFSYIIDSCDITPLKAYDLFNKKDTILLFLGTPKLNVEEHFHQIRKYEKKNDWTYDRSDEEILKSCSYWLEKSREYEKECERLNIWYVDTSFNREIVLNNTLKEIEKKVKKF